jgi:Predicted phosphatase homologous to the C-terminal domain of histone macroH2A1
VPSYCEGDIFTSKAQVIIHGCNTRGKFGKGFAFAIRQHHPEAHQAYEDAYRTTGLMLGSIVWAQSGTRVVGNCITQPTYGNDGKLHLSYDALRECLASVNRAGVDGVPGTSVANGFSKVWLPMIGADLGGGDWEKISRIIDDEMTDVEAIVHYLPKDRNKVLTATNPRLLTR